MTTYTFNPSSVTTRAYAWSDPSTWDTGIVPNSADADVVIPAEYPGDTPPSGRPGSGYYSFAITVAASQSYGIRSLAIAANELDVVGTLTIAGDLNINSLQPPALGVVNITGTLSLGSLSGTGLLMGSGQLTSPGAFVSRGTIYQMNVALTDFTNDSQGMVDGGVISTANGRFDNQGMVAGGTIEAANGGFANFSGSTLTGGTYTYEDLNVGGLIVTDAAVLNVVDDTNTIRSFDSVSQSYLPVQATLRMVAPTGTLNVFDYTTTNLTVEGLLNLSAGTTFQSSSPVLTADTLTIAAGGRVTANGTIDAAITNDGTLTATETPNVLGTLLVHGNVSGSGVLGIGSGTSLELDGTCANGVAFVSTVGQLILDRTAALSGTITPRGSGDTIDLAGLDPATVTGVSYAGTTSGGTLTIAHGGASTSLRFVGSYGLDNFRLTTVRQPFANSAPSLLITVFASPVTGSNVVVDGSQGTQDIIGTGPVNVIDTGMAAGTGSIVVDLSAGTVTRGGVLDAVLTNIQGVRLGADISDVKGLAAGADVFYGGSGTDTFRGNGATDTIYGGSGTNLVFGSTGNQIAYGSGGQDVMRGGSAANFMSGGSTASSTDVFYGTGGNDYVYGHGGGVDLVGGTGNEFLSAGSGFNELDDRQQPVTGPVGLSVLTGSTGTDLFYAGIGTNLIIEGSGTDTFVGSTGTDFVYGGAGRSFTYAGSGTDVVTTGAGNDYVKTGSGTLYVNDTAANLQAGRYDFIDNFSGGSTDLYLPAAVQGATSFISQNGGTAVVTAVSGGTATLFASNADLGAVQAHTHFTL